MATPECAVLLIDKPAGVTSHDVVNEARERFDTQRVGHCGTLDPFATGLLVVLLGRATRLQRYLLHLPKTYNVVAQLGWTSTTGDRDGELQRTGRVAADPQLPVGEIELPVPAFSAIKVDGERLYHAARRGEDVTPPVRTMVVYRAQRMALDGELATFEIDCAGGTYVRSLVGTLEDAYCQQLSRTRIADISLDDAADDVLHEPLSVLGHLKQVDLSLEDASGMVCGRSLNRPGLEHGSAIALKHDGRMFGVGHVVDDLLRPQTVLVQGLEELTQEMAQTR
ncbi:MAG: tRNA pseudouridine(55) synthase TruB [Thermoleophilaceae bacterium]|nr:tRNA pseudouridine(55) synthase TruB [Thermoleophilaceae bacterium]